jgi:aryl-alcohol dehydrogenase-like predicted oxidoreductase
LRVGRLALGTLGWGRETDLDEASGILAGFRDAGGTLVCTADGFGAGAAQEVTGRLVGAASDRAEVVLAAQTGSPWGPPPAGSRRALLAALDASLDTLRTDHVDLWLVRGRDPQVPLAETLGAVETAVASGRALYVGFTDLAGWELAAAATTQSVLPGRQPVAAVHAEWSLLCRDTERELVPAARACGVGLLPASPLGRGVLTGKYRGGIPRDSRGADEAWKDFVGAYLTEAAT